MPEWHDLKSLFCSTSEAVSRVLTGFPVTSDFYNMLPKFLACLIWSYQDYNAQNKLEECYAQRCTIYIMDNPGPLLSIYSPSNIRTTQLKDLDHLETDRTVVWCLSIQKKIYLRSLTAFSTTYLQPINQCI